MGYSKKWNQPNGVGRGAAARASSSQKVFRGKRRALIAASAALLAVFAFLAVKCILGPAGRNPPAEGPRAVPAVDTNGNARAVGAAVPTNAPTAVRPLDPHEGMVLSPAGVWQPTNRPWRADAKKVHNVHTNWSHTAKHKVPYRNSVEQLLLTTFTCPLGTCPPPLMRIPKRDMDRLVDILIDKPSVEDGDTPLQIADKEVIAAAKQKMKDYVRKGGRPETFLKSYHNQLQRAYELRSAAIREINRIVTEEGDADLARDFHDEMNRRFKKEGIRPIHIDIEKSN